MTFISSLALWFSNNEGEVIIEWFGWQVITSPPFFIISIILIFFFIYIFFSFTLSLYNIPKKTLMKVKKKRIKNAINALNEGVIASFYGNKKDVLKNLKIAKKTLNDSPLLILLELQNSLFRGDQNSTFTLLTKMLDIKVLKPLAVKSLIAYSIKNKDDELFKNILNRSLDKNIDFSWIQKDVFKYSIQNNNWNDLLNYLQKKISISNKANKRIISIVYFQIALEHYFLKDMDNAKLFLRKALKLNNFFPPFMELYCKLNSGKNQNQIEKFLKRYWLINPNPNIEQCIENSFKESSALSKLKISSKILLKIIACIIVASKYGDHQRKKHKFQTTKEAYYFYETEEDLKINRSFAHNLSHYTIKVEILFTGDVIPVI